MPLSSVRGAESGVAIFATSSVVRFALLRIGQPYLAPVNPQEAVLVARSLAAGQGFSNPYGCVTGATAHLAPVYPFLLSIFDRIFSPGSLREVAIYVFSALTASLAYALLPWLAARLRLDPRIGVAAGFAGAIVPLYFWVEVWSEWEAPLTALLLIVTLGVFARLFERTCMRSAALAGIFCGALLLTCPTALPLLIVLSVALLLERREDFAAVVPPAIALWGIALLAVAPWTVRNYRLFHEFIFVRGNAGLEMHVSFNAKAGVAFEDTVAKGGYVDHPHASLQSCAEFARYGEIAMNRKFQAEADEWIRAHPGKTAVLLLQRVGAFWYLVPTETARSVLAGFVSLVGLLGLGICLKRGLFAGRLLGIVMVVYPLVYYVPKFDIRYRYPIHPLLLLLGSLAVVEIRKGVFGPQMNADKRRKIE